MMQLRVTLNGTDRNPWHRWGLTQNPFPQLGKAEYDAHCLRLQSLGGDPIPDTDYIRKVLEGWSPEFVELCCQRFKKGAIVQFHVAFNESKLGV